MRRTIRIGWLPGLGVVIAVGLVLALRAARLRHAPMPCAFAPGGTVRVTFTVPAAVSARRSGDSLVIHTNVPWTATLTSVTQLGRARAAGVPRPEHGLEGPHAAPARSASCRSPWSRSADATRLS